MTAGKLILKGCRHCGGDLALEDEVWTKRGHMLDYGCIQCGRHELLEGKREAKRRSYN